MVVSRCHSGLPRCTNHFVLQLAGGRDDTVVAAAEVYKASIGVMRAFRPTQNHSQNPSQGVWLNRIVRHAVMCRRPAVLGAWPLAHPELHALVGVPGTIVIQEHTRVGTGFHRTALVADHWPSGSDFVRNVPSALAFNLPGRRWSSYHVPPNRPLALSLPWGPPLTRTVMYMKSVLRPIYSFTEPYAASVLYKKMLL